MLKRPTSTENGSHQNRCPTELFGIETRTQHSRRTSYKPKTSRAPNQVVHSAPHFHTACLRTKLFCLTSCGLEVKTRTIIKNESVCRIQFLRSPTPTGKGSRQDGCPTELIFRIDTPPRHSTRTSLQPRTHLMSHTVYITILTHPYCLFSY